MDSRATHQGRPGESSGTPTLRQGAQMAAYVLIDRLVVTDPDAFSAYHDLALASVTAHGGRHVLPAGHTIDALEGNWTPTCIVLIAFDDADHLKQWWDSSEYAQARTIHRQATISNIILVDDSAG